MDAARLKNFVETCWDESVVPALVEYIMIPNKSPAFDRDWASHGYMDKAVELFTGWARPKVAKLPGASLEAHSVEDPMGSDARPQGFDSKDHLALACLHRFIFANIRARNSIYGNC